jgi:bacterioferritin
MKGDTKVIEQLNLRLSEELAAISQYMVHSEMDADWGYAKLHETVEKRAIDEMKHAEKLIGRILFLEGQQSGQNHHRRGCPQADPERPRRRGRRDQSL